MSALSQNLTFRVTNGNTTTSSVQVVHTISTTDALTLVSDPVKGNGYFSNGAGLHTVFWKISEFVGSVEVQSTLASEPTDRDWFTVKLINSDTYYTADTSGLVTITGQQYSTATSISKSYNFIGNFIWIRAKISNWTQGTVNFISINR
jgi:hypothetical protein